MMGFPGGKATPALVLVGFVMSYKKRCEEQRLIEMKQERETLLKRKAAQVSSAVNPPQQPPPAQKEVAPRPKPEGEVPPIRTSKDVRMTAPEPVGDDERFKADVG